MTNVASWVKNMVERHTGSSPFEIGMTVKHPDGRPVKIVDGQYWGEHGVSNFWRWKEVLKDGSLSDKTEYGYGWR